MEALLGAALVVDIHASNVYLREIPQVRIARAFEPKLVPLARRMNLDLIWIHEAMTVLENTIAHSLNERGVPCLVAEMGVGMRVTPAFAEQVVTGILHVRARARRARPGARARAGASTSRSSPTTATCTT